jgi:hypothetical protein
VFPIRLPLFYGGEALFQSPPTLTSSIAGEFPFDASHRFLKQTTTFGGLDSNSGLAT